MRARDGRGPRTQLERAVPQYFGLARPETVARAIHGEALDEARLVELPPIVFEVGTRTLRLTDLTTRSYGSSNRMR